MTKIELAKATVMVVSAYITRNVVLPGHLPILIQDVGGSFSTLGEPGGATSKKTEHPPRPTNNNDPSQISCLVCGRNMKILRRHLLSRLGMSPLNYRQAYGLPDKFPLVARDYSKRRSEMAKASGLGRKRD